MPTSKKTQKATAAGRRPAERTTTVDQLTPDKQNPRRRTTRGRELLVKSLKDYGAARSIVVDERDEILAGNGVVDAARDAGITKVRIIDAAGDELIAVRRRGLTDDQKRALAIADNRTGELAEWNAEEVIAARDAGLDLRPFWTPEEEAELASKAGAAAIVRIAEDDDSSAATAQPTDDVQTFSCALSVEQERIVRAGIRLARAVYGVETTANALAAVMKAWTDEHAQAQPEPRRRSRRAAVVQ